MYSLKKAKDIAAVKAISQNLMHSSITTTDKIYGILSEMDIQDEIRKIGENENTTGRINESELLQLLKSLVQSLENRNQQ